MNYCVMKRVGNIRDYYGPYSLHEVLLSVCEKIVCPAVIPECKQSTLFLGNETKFELPGEAAEFYLQIIPLQTFKG